MCGIVGMAGDLAYSDKALFRDMLDVCQLRGRDGTGVIKVDLKDEVSYDKQVGPPNLLVDNDIYKRVIETGIPKALIGHCRLKTTGGTTRANTHPFHFDHITGVHNGTLKSMGDLENRNDFEVDSACLYYNIAKKGIENVLPVVTGAWALVYWNEADNTLNFIRNSERPLWLTWSEDFRKLYWASERWMFNAITRKEKIWDGGEEKKPYIELPEDTLWSFEIDGMAKKGDNVFHMKAPQKIEGKVWGGVAHENFQKKTTPGFTKGGSKVPDPFVVQGDEDDDLDVVLPPSQSLVILPNQEESMTTFGSLKHVEKPSSKVLDFRQGSTRTRNLLPLPIYHRSKRSRLYLPANKDDSSSSCVAKSDSAIFNTRHISIRTCAGMEFITDEHTKKEYSLAAFTKKNHGVCCYCNTAIGGLEEVAQIYDDGDRFICTSCTADPVLISEVNNKE